METKIFSKENIDEAAEILRRGGLVAFPTETVYGLGGNGLDPEAARKIYAAKGRPSDNPLILHVAKIEEVLPLVDSIPEKARLLMESFWPGPLTLRRRGFPLRGRPQTFQGTRARRRRRMFIMTLPDESREFWMTERSVSE